MCRSGIGKGKSLATGVPAHPTRKIFDDPATFEFARPIGGTYPLWYDITYWYEGIQTRFDAILLMLLTRLIPDVIQQAKVIWSNLAGLKDLLLGLHGSLISGLVVLLFTSSRGWLIVRDIGEYWFLIFPTLAALGLYSLVLVLDRYVAPFLPVLFLTVFFGVRLRGIARKRKSRQVPASVPHLVNWRDPKSHPYWEVDAHASVDDRVAVLPGLQQSDYYT